VVVERVVCNQWVAGFNPKELVVVEHEQLDVLLFYPAVSILKGISGSGTTCANSFYGFSGFNPKRLVVVELAEWVDTAFLFQSLKGLVVVERQNLPKRKA